MDYYHFKPLQGDPLWIIRLFGSDIYQHGLSKIVLLVILLVHMTITLIETYYMIFFMSGKEFAKYGSIFFAFFYVLLGSFTLLYKNRILNETIDLLYKWSFDTCGRKLEKKLNFEAKIVSFGGIVITGLAITGGILFAIPIEADKEFFFFFRLTEEWFPKYKEVLNCCYRLLHIPVALTLIAHGLQAVYGFFTACFQSFLVIEYLKKLTADFDDLSDETLVFDEDFQMQLRKRLCLFINRNVEQRMCFKSALHHVKPLILQFSIIGCLFGISVVFFIQGNHGIFSFAVSVRLLVTGCAGFLTFAGIIISGQKGQTLAEEIHAAVKNVKWYNWSLDSKKKYLVVLANTASPAEMRFSRDFAINYESGVSLMKALYSAISVFSNLSSRDG